MEVVMEEEILSEVGESDEEDDDSFYEAEQPPDTIEDFYYSNNDESYWLSEEHAFELQEQLPSTDKVPPPVSDWKEIDASSKIDLTVAKARRLLWEQAQSVINLHRDNVTALQGLSGAEITTSGIDKVYKLLFGPKSKLAVLFKDEIDLTEEQYLLFLMSYFKSCRFRMSVGNLQESDDNFYLMPVKDYNLIWSKIAKLPRQSSSESFWQQVELIMNKNYKQLFMESTGTVSRNETDSSDEELSMKFVMGLDDDKIHYNYSADTYTDGLSKDHHAVDNRHGFTAHTLAHSATAAPIHVSFQRLMESVNDTTMRMLLVEAFGRHTGQVPDLNNVKIAMDRGYWLAKLLFTLLNLGADVHGTIKRMDFVPLTYDPKKKDDSKRPPFPEKPLLVECGGYKDAYYMQTKWKGTNETRKLGVNAYRSGSSSGAVSIALSSFFIKPHWDFIPQKDADQVWYHNRSLSHYARQKKAMKLLVGHDDTEECIHLMLDAMNPRTCEQGTADWFLDRKLSGTSSTIAEIVVAVAPLIDDTCDPDIYDSFQTVLDYAGCSNILGSAIAAALPPDDNDNEEDSDNEADNEEAKTQAQSWIDTLLNEDVDMDEEFRTEMAEGNIDPDVSSWIVAIMKKQPFKRMPLAAASKAIEKDFLSHDKRRRSLEPLKVAQLKEMATSKGVKATGLKKSALIDELLKPSNTTERGAGPQSKKKSKTKPSDVPAELQPTYRLLKQSFMRPQTKRSDRSAASIGHRNEEPFMQSFYKECRKDDDNNNPYSFSKLEPVAIYRLGLMQKRDCKFAKASLDGALFVNNDDGNLELIPIEVKSRVKAATAAAAKDRVEEEVGAELYDERKKYLLSVTSRDGLLRTLLSDESNPTRQRNEAFQLLHGAFVSSAKRGMFLIGSRDRLLYAINVAFEEELLESFNTVMDYIYENFFKCFYEESIDQLNENQTIAEAISYLPQIDGHSFWTNVMLWRSLNVDVNPNNTPFPLLPCSRLLPIQQAYWNVLKGPSDTTTKLLDMIEENIGVRTPRTIATGQLLSVGAVAFHRSNQMLSAKKDLSKGYTTLYSYRHAANSRFGMANSVERLIKLIKADISKLQSNPLAALIRAPVPLNTPPRRNTRGHVAEERVAWIPLKETSYTPKRGRSVNDMHKQREAQCDGRVLLWLDNRKPCRLCGINTNFYCSGCKNSLCHGSQSMSDSRIKAIMKKNPSLVPPKPKLKLPYQDANGEWQHEFGTNTCYLLLHHKSFCDCWDAKHETEINSLIGNVNQTLNISRTL